MIADVVVYHPTISHYLKFAATTAGRDKLLRTIQYFARFYVWYLLRTDGTKGQIAPWETLKKQFGLARKLLHVGKNLEHFKAAAVAIDSKSMDPVMRYTTIGRQMSYFAYLSADSATVLDVTGIRRWEGAKRLQKEAYRFWTVGLICSVTCQIYSLYRLRQREALVDRKEGEGAVESKRIVTERVNSQLQLLTDVCDIVLPTSALGWIKVNDGMVGLAGTLSSLIGLYVQWAKSA